MQDALKGSWAVYSDRKNEVVREKAERRHANVDVSDLMCSQHRSKSGEISRPITYEPCRARSMRLVPSSSQVIATDRSLLH